MKSQIAMKVKHNSKGSEGAMHLHYARPNEARANAAPYYKASGLKKIGEINAPHKEIKYKQELLLFSKGTHRRSTQCP